MKTKYILIKKNNLFEFENPEGSKHNVLDYEFIIKINESNNPQFEEKILFEENILSPSLVKHFSFEILDRKGSLTEMKINHLTVSEINYNFKTQDIIFVLNQYPRVIHQEVFFKRTQYEIKNHLKQALEKISSISISDNLTIISRLD